MVGGVKSTNDFRAGTNSAACEGCEALLTSWTLFLLPLASWCGAAGVSINTF